MKQSTLFIIIFFVCLLAMLTYLFLSTTTTTTSTEIDPSAFEAYLKTIPPEALNCSYMKQYVLLDDKAYMKENWGKVLSAVQSGQMPPPAYKNIWTPEQKNQFVAAIQRMVIVTEEDTNESNLIQYIHSTPTATVQLLPLANDVKEPTSIIQIRGILFVTLKTGLFYSPTSKEVLETYDFQKQIKGFNSESENGLLCCCRDPDFSTNQRLYFSYTIKSGEDEYYLKITAYRVDMKGRALILEKDIFTMMYSTTIHHGGTIQFDQQKRLYLSTGDGGPQKDPENNAQNLQSYKGKILRILPDTKIIAYGLRNPWRFSIDARQRMFIGDVGYASVESVYMIPNINPSHPYNFGWNYFEGGNTPLNPRGHHPSEFTLPIFEYRNPEQGRAVIGGYFDEQKQVYVFADYTGLIYVLQQQPNQTWSQIAKNDLGDGTHILSMGYIDTHLYALTNTQIIQVRIQDG